MADVLPRLRPPLLGLAGALAFAAAASAQTMNANSASYNAGWGRSPDQENRAVDPTLRDSNGNLEVINGVITTGSNASAFSGGAASASSGAGVGGATAIGNSLSVVVQGNDNTVVVDSRQINNGKVTATSTASGVGGNGS